VILPALEAARRDGMRVDGPIGADTLLQRAGYDAYVVMLHDQGHVAAKLLAPNRAAALTIARRCCSPRRPRRRARHRRAGARQPARDGGSDYPSGGPSMKKRPWPVVPARRFVRQAGNVKPVPG